MWIPSRGVNGEYGYLNIETGEFPNKITNTPSTIELLIFEDEQIHLPFHVQCTPAKKYSIIVKRYRDNKEIQQYIVSNKYVNKLHDLLYDQGVRVINGKWTVNEY